MNDPEPLLNFENSFTLTKRRQTLPITNTSPPTSSKPLLRMSPTLNHGSRTSSLLNPRRCLTRNFRSLQLKCSSERTSEYTSSLLTLLQILTIVPSGSSTRFNPSSLFPSPRRRLRRPPNQQQKRPLLPLPMPIWPMLPKCQSRVPRRKLETTCQ